MIPLLYNTFDTKYRAKSFTDSDSETNTNPYEHYVIVKSWYKYDIIFITQSRG